MCQYLYLFMHRVERAPASVKCLVEEHKTALTQTAGSRVQCTKHEATVTTSVKGKSVGEMQCTISIIFWVPLLAVFLEFNMASFAFLARQHYLEISKNVLLTMFLVFSLEVELTVPPRFASASSMSSSGMTTELVTYTLAKRSAELDRFGLFSKDALLKGVHLSLLRL